MVEKKSYEVKITVEIEGYEKLAFAYNDERYLRKEDGDTEEKIIDELVGDLHDHIMETVEDTVSQNEDDQWYEVYDNEEYTETRVMTENGEFCNQKELEEGE